MREKLLIWAKNLSTRVEGSFQFQRLVVSLFLAELVVVVLYVTLLDAFAVWISLLAGLGGLVVGYRGFRAWETTVHNWAIQGMRSALMGVRVPGYGAGVVDDDEAATLVLEGISSGRTLVDLQSVAAVLEAKYPEGIPVHLAAALAKAAHTKVRESVTFARAVLDQSIKVAQSRAGRAYWISLGLAVTGAAFPILAAVMYVGPPPISPCVFHTRLARKSTVVTRTKGRCRAAECERIGNAA